MNARYELDESWIAAFGWSLYRAWHPEDKNMKHQIRIPTGDGREEFDTVILSLAKMLIDYIDKSQLESNKNGSINNLEDFLMARSIEIDLSVLRDLQSLRSSGVAHSKGRKYEQLRNSLLTDNAIEDAKSIIDRLTKFLITLKNAIDSYCEHTER
jgi:hypothetical protein